MNKSEHKIEDAFQKEILDRPDHERIEMASKVGQFINEAENSSDKDMAMAHSIATHLTEDAIGEVRKAFSEEVASCSFLDPELAQTIARDIGEICVPFLSKTKALEDEVLEALVEEVHEDARVAIASRDGLSEGVSFAISTHGGEESVQTLMENVTAEISKRVCTKTMERFDQNPKILNSMSERSDLPLTILDSLIDKLSDEIREKLVKSYKLGDEYASYIAGQTKFKARFAVLEKASQKEMHRFFRNLKTDGLLDDTTLIQVLQNIGVDAFKIGLEVKSGLSSFLVDKHLKDGTREAIATLFDKAKVSKGLAGTMFKTYLMAVKNN